MPEQLALALAIRRCPPSVEGALRQRFYTVMADLAAHYGVRSVRLRVDGNKVQVIGPLGGLKAEAARPAQPMPPVTHPLWYGWCAQAALWAHRSSGCRGCGRRGKRLKLNRFGHCPNCAKRNRDDQYERQKPLLFGRHEHGVTTRFKGVKRAPKALRRAA